MAKLTGIPWVRIGAEGLVIVASILLALAADAWWSDREERNRLTTQVREVEAGLLEGLASLTPHTQEVAAAVDRLKHFVEATSFEEGAIQPDEARLYLIAITQPHTRDNNRILLRQTLNDDLLNGLGDADLRTAAADWREVLTQLDEIEAALAAHWNDALRGLGAHDSVRRFWTDMDQPVAPTVVAEVWRDGDVVALAARKLVLMNAQLSYLRALGGTQNHLLDVIRRQTG